jgi:hypothetical protein
MRPKSAYCRIALHKALYLQAGTVVRTTPKTDPGRMAFGELILHWFFVVHRQFNLLFQSGLPTTIVFSAS